MVRQMQKHLTNWRHTMKKHWVEVGGEVDTERVKSKPFGSVTSSNWEILCDFWAFDSVISCANQTLSVQFNQTWVHQLTDLRLVFGITGVPATINKSEKKP